MRVPNHARSSEVGFNMTPMIDVVFLLIIFFLVSSHLVKQETQMELSLPQVEKTDAAAQDDVPRVTINVTPEGNVFMSGHQLTRDQLRRRLSEKVNDDPAGKDLEVRIRGDRNVPYAKISPIMIDCTKVGLWNVNFLVYRKEDVR